MVPWQKSEIEGLISWMEENPEQLHGKQSRWYRDVKDEVFYNDEHITVKKINDKASNMKKASKEAKASQGDSGWGLREEDERNIQKKLEKKCQFFSRLDGIWGSRPNVRIITRVDSTEVRAAPSAPPSPA